MVNGGSAALRRMVGPLAFGGIEKIGLVAGFRFGVFLAGSRRALFRHGKDRGCGPFLGSGRLLVGDSLAVDSRAAVGGDW